MKARVIVLLPVVLVCLGVAPFAGRAASEASAQAAPVGPVTLGPVAVAPVTLRPVATDRSVHLQPEAFASTGVPADVLTMAIGAITCAVNTGALDMPPTLTLIDYSKPSTEPRLWVFDLATGEMLFEELVAHGKNTGENMAQSFSDTLNSRQSSLGLFRTADTYTGSNGYSLRLDGLEPGFNSHARERAIVMHGAPYVSAQFVAAQGRIGRSWGCPALRTAIAAKVIDTIRGGGVIFSYYPDSNWLRTSRFLNGCDTAPATLATR